MPDIPNTVHPVFKHAPTVWKHIKNKICNTNVADRGLLVFMLFSLQLKKWWRYGNDGGGGGDKTALVWVDFKMTCCQKSNSFLIRVSEERNDTNAKPKTTFFKYARKYTHCITSTLGLDIHSAVSWHCYKTGSICTDWDRTAFPTETSFL